MKKRNPIIRPRHGEKISINPKTQERILEALVEYAVRHMLKAIVPAETVRWLVFCDGKEIKWSMCLFDNLIILRERKLVMFSPKLEDHVNFTEIEPFEIEITPEGLAFLGDLIEKRRMDAKIIWMDIFSGVIGALVGAIGGFLLSKC